MHLEATAVLLGLQDPGGKLTTRSHIGVILGPSFVGDVEAKSGYGRSCRRCSAMLLDLCPEVLSPRSTKILSGFWQAMCKDRSNILGPGWGQVWPSWALLRYLEATALLLAAKLGDLEGKLAYREVMLKLSWAMLCHVEAICQILFRHVVGFALPHALCWPDFGVKWLSCGHVGPPSWDQLRPSRGP